MKKVNLLTAMAFLAVTLFTNSVSARIWRVNNFSNYNTTLGQYGENYGGISSNPVFKEVDDAIQLGSVQAHDTLYLEGSPNPYNGFTLTKSLVIVGAGYFLTENIHVSSDMQSSKIGAYVDIQSDSTSILAIEYTPTSCLNIAANNVSIERCRINGTVCIASHLPTGYDNITIRANYFNSSGVTAPTSTAGLPNHIIINNNIFNGNLLIPNTGVVLAQCNNNVFNPSITSGTAINISTAEFLNNILKNGTVNVNINSSISTNIAYNISATPNGAFGTSNNNITDSPANVFVTAGSVSTDGDFQLKPAYATGNFGSDTTQRGAYGGAVPEFRYTLSGLAPIPVIYNVYTSGAATSTQGLPVTIKARTIK
jgi:hypothetical protein